MPECYFVSDLHGKTDRYYKLFEKIKTGKPAAVFLGGDLLPHYLQDNIHNNYLVDFVAVQLCKLKEELGDEYPQFFAIMGNDDPRRDESYMLDIEDSGLWNYLNSKTTGFGVYTVLGYPFVNPTPFRLKDWEKYDVSRYADPGCIHPTEGFRTIESTEDVEYATIEKDIAALTQDLDLSKTICLFHSPPYQTVLDRAALDDIKVEGVPMDVHVGSIAIKRFIEEQQPLLTLHGHIHESAEITGEWKQKIGKTWCLGAAINKPALSLVVFDPEHPEVAERFLL
jgi:uncharacterized protein